MGLDANRRINWKAPVLGRYNVRSLPTYFVIDRSGSIAARGQLSEVVKALP